MTFTLQELITLTGFALLLTAAGVAVRASVLRSTAEGWKQQAEQRGVELSSLKQDVEELRREHHETKAELQRTRDELHDLKDRYIKLLEARNADYVQGFARIAEELQDVKATIACMTDGRLMVRTGDRKHEQS